MANKILICILAAVYFIVMCACLLFSDLSPGEASAGNNMKIASLSPAITQTLVALGLVNDIVGATSFCKLPKTDHEVMVLGGFGEANVEALKNSGADVAVIPTNMSFIKEKLEKNGIRVSVFSSNSIQELKNSIADLGALTGQGAIAKSIIEKFDAKFEHMRQKRLAGTPRVLFAIIHPDNCNKPAAETDFIGNDGFYDHIITIAGGINAYGGKLPYPKITQEAILSLRPDLLILSAPECSDSGQTLNAWRSLWRDTGTSPHFLLLDSREDTIPGPSSLGTAIKIRNALEDVARARTSPLQ